MTLIFFITPVVLSLEREDVPLSTLIPPFVFHFSDEIERVCLVSKRYQADNESLPVFTTFSRKECDFVKSSKLEASLLANEWKAIMEVIYICIIVDPI